MKTEIKLLAEKIKNSQVWDLDDCKQLCAFAGLESEWTAAEGGNFETVLYKAAEILNVEII